MREETGKCNVSKMLYLIAYNKMLNHSVLVKENTSVIHALHLNSGVDWSIQPITYLYRFYSLIRRAEYSFLSLFLSLCVFVCICMCTCMCVYAYACACVCVWACMWPLLASTKHLLRGALYWNPDAQETQWQFPACSLQSREEGQTHKGWTEVQ